MAYVQHFYDLLLNSIKDDVRQTWKNKLADIRFTPWATMKRSQTERTNRFIDFTHSALRKTWIIFSKVGVYALEVFSGCGQPAYTHSGTKHLLEANVHLVFLDKDAAVRLTDSFLKDLMQPTITFV